MRGADDDTSQLFSYLSPESRVRPDHPLRAIRRLTDTAFAELPPQFDRLYSDIGRPSIPPEQLLGACWCRRSIRFAASGSSWRRSTTAFCFAGSSGSGSMADLVAADLLEESGPVARGGRDRGVL